MAEHTPTPWRNSPNSFGTQFIYGDLENPRQSPMGVTYCELVCGGDNPKRLTEANAAFIVKAVNNHEALVERLKEAHLQIEYMHSKFDETGSGNAVLARINATLSDVGGVAK